MRPWPAVRCLLPLIALLVLLPAAAPHPNSFSSSRVTVRGADALLELRCQAQSLLEVFGSDVDRDGDGWFGDAELLALREPLHAYVSEHYVLRAGSGGDGRAGTLLHGELVSLGASEPHLDVAWPTQWVELALEYRATEPIPDLLLDVTIFREAAPDHRDLCELVWNGGEPLETLFWMGEYRRYYAPEMAPAAPPALAPADTPGTAFAMSAQVPLRAWVAMGVGHILSGWDHLAFVAALLVAAGSVRALLGVVTVFTLAHSLTLALAATGVVSVPARPVEVVIALSIAWVGVATLVARRPRARWPEAFAFGLVHGLGFAGFLGDALQGEARPLRALAGFNLGVEAGQLLVVAVALAVLAAGRASGGRRRDALPSAAGGTWLVPRAVRVPVCLTVALAGLWWTVTRLLGA